MSVDLQRPQQEGQQEALPVGKNWNRLEELDQTKLMLIRALNIHAHIRDQNLKLPETARFLERLVMVLKLDIWLTRDGEAGGQSGLSDLGKAAMQELEADPGFRLLRDRYGNINLFHEYPGRRRVGTFEILAAELAQDPAFKKYVERGARKQFNLLKIKSSEWKIYIQAALESMAYEMHDYAIEYAGEIHHRRSNLTGKLKDSWIHSLELIMGSKSPHARKLVNVQNGRPATHALGHNRNHVVDLQVDELETADPISLLKLPELHPDSPESQRLEQALQQLSPAQRKVFLKHYPGQLALESGDAEGFTSLEEHALYHKALKRLTNIVKKLQTGKQS